MCYWFSRSRYVRLSAEQREQQRQQMMHNMGVLARNLNLLREAFKELAAHIEQSDKVSADSYSRIRVKLDDFVEDWSLLNERLVALELERRRSVNMTFLQRLRWLFRGI